MKDKLLKIINHYGIIPQLKYFQSEVFELNEAIIKHENKSALLKTIESMNKATNKQYMVQSIENIKEEVADILVMLTQFIDYYDLNLEEIKDVMKYKIDRQIERIEND